MKGCILEKISIADWLIILATLLSPVIAVQVTRYLDERNEIRGRKLSIFKTLMATRAYTISWAHVEALNRIDLEFVKSQKKEKAVVEAWKEYHDLLNNDKLSPEQWATKRIELLVELLHKMAIVLDYDFDKTHIKNSSYAPRIHSDTEAQQEAIRKGVIDVLAGNRPLPMVVTNLNNQDG
ncbi:hypothetical protein PSAKL28_10760 [Pseudomonas alkylphenolica]|uniref:DUF6680 domain-containing protein n=1 Tax=Pseudomonas alkylphenolica TaxID=237609 RepID=A0A077F495_9PSED|nr:hypothetical protein PSAKL28_10760 [Pseudomonas alkylphenolica]